jgi:hypothetical protein
VDKVHRACVQLLHSAGLDDCSAHLREQLLKDLDQLNRTIKETQDRLGAYRFQKDNEN